MGFQSRPFISHDAPDANGVRCEIQVTKGTGLVKDIKYIDDGKNAHVFLEPGNLTFNNGLVAGWINTDQPPFPILKAAYENGTEVEYRIETQRRKSNTVTHEKITRETPLYEVWGSPDGKNINGALVGQTCRKLLVGAANEGEDMLFARDAMTNPKEDPQYGAAKSALDMDLAELSPQNTSAVPAAAKVVDNPFNEPNPWLPTRSDGTINPGSYEVQAYYEMYFFLKENASKAGFELQDKGAKSLAAKLLVTADKIQQGFYNTDTAPARTLGSHARAREIVRGVITNIHPLQPDDVKSNPAAIAWLREVDAAALSVADWSLAAASKHLDSLKAED